LDLNNENRTKREESGENKGNKMNVRGKVIVLCNKPAATLLAVLCALLGLSCCLSSNLYFILSVRFLRLKGSGVVMIQKF